MEVAGLQVARHVWQLGGSTRRVDVVAGHGNNGGDGLVAARYLAGWGVEVRVHLVAEADRLAPLPAAQLAAVAAANIEVIEAASGAVEVDRDGLVVDALLGSGLRGDPRPPQRRAIESIESSDVVAVDVPSGLDATSGRVATPTVSATSTVTLGAMKAGMWAGPGRRRCGRILVADIGIPDSAWRECGLVPPTAVRGGGFWPVPSDTP